MDSALSQLLFQGNPLLWDCNALLEPAGGSSDPGYYSSTGSLSPASSVDSLCLSPPSLPWGTVDASVFCDRNVQPKKAPSHPVRGGRRSRSKFPGKKRQSASEREKLRMRDLTKALHHLRTYLPPSVAPAGQTLTKIETLRLAIRYIGHLSAQLGLSEETLSHRSLADSPLPLPGSQDILQSPYQPSMASVEAEMFTAFQMSSPGSSDHFSPLLSHQNSIGSYSFTQTSPEDYWMSQFSHNPYGQC